MEDIIRRPEEIEKRSMEIIAVELAQRGIELPPSERAVTMRAIHASADFDYAENLRFLTDPLQAGIAALKGGAVIVTDTNMALSGIHISSVEAFGCRKVCYMADPVVAETARKEGRTRAAVSMQKAAGDFEDIIFVIGNAPTALLEVAALIREGLIPALVIGLPVGFVNVVESKEEAEEVCRACGIPAIIGAGRKGGSSVAAAVMNAVIYEAVGRVL